MPIDLTGNPLRPAPPKPKRYMRPLWQRQSFQVEWAKLNMAIQYGWTNEEEDLDLRCPEYYM